MQVKLYVNLVKSSIKFTVGKVKYIHVVLSGLFKGAYYNSEAGATRTVNLRVRTKQGRGEIKEIRFLPLTKYNQLHDGINNL